VIAARAGPAHVTQGGERVASPFAGNGLTDRLRLPGRGTTIPA
jgi:hypothetical protein